MARKAGEVVLLAGFFSATAFAYSPSLRWRTVKTGNFTIHYHRGEESVAKRAASIAESVWPQLRRESGWTPKGRVQIVLVDDLDIANGFATPFPYNLVGIFVPSPEHDGSLSDYDDWLRLVITHELSHIVHLDMAHGLPRVYRYIFGRTPLGFFPIFPTAFPNLSQPSWLIEGYAAHLETKLTSGGRGRNSYFDMMLRCAFLEGRVSTLGQMTDWQTSWPGGTIRYLYGVSLYDYMAASIRDDAPRRLIRENSESLYPQFHINSAPESFGLTYRVLYERWRRKMTSRYQTQREEILRQPLTESVALTSSGYQTDRPSYSPDGSQVAFVSQNADSLPSLRLLGQNGAPSKRLAEGWVRSGPSWSPDGRSIAFAMLDYNRTYSLKSDLYIYELSGKRLRRLTRSSRAFDPAWSPDGSQLAYVQIKPGGQDLMAWDLAKRRARVLLMGHDGDEFSRPSWSKDGARLAFTRWSGGAMDIEVLTLAEGATEFITSDRALDMDPCWSGDGRRIYFTSDRSGVFNIYAYSYDDKAIHQVTNVIGGAFNPAVSPNEDLLIFSNYSSRGFDLHQMKLSTANFSSAPVYVDRHPARPAWEPEAPIISDKTYSPVQSVLPRFWMPSFKGGIVLAGLDAVERHDYYVATQTGGDYEFSYSYHGLFPSIEFNKWRLERNSAINITSGWSGQPVWPGDGWSLFLRFPLERVLRSQSIAFGYLESRIDPLKAQRENTRLPSKVLARVGGYDTAWTFSNAKIYGFSIAPEDGRVITADYFVQGNISSKDTSIAATQGSWTEYLPGVARHHVLALEIGGGRSNQTVFDTIQFRTLADNLRRGWKSLSSRLSPSQFSSFADRGAMDLPLSKTDAGFFSTTANLSASYAFPIAYIERAPGVGFFFLDRLRGKVFAFGDKYWNINGSSTGRRLFSGAELSSDWGLSYFLPVTLSVSAQRRIDKKSDWGVGGRLDLYIRY